VYVATVGHDGIVAMNALPLSLRLLENLARPHRRQKRIKIDLGIAALLKPFRW
jgi:hypothetical protein